jgi:hypothetical protein
MEGPFLFCVDWVFFFTFLGWLLRWDLYFIVVRAIARFLLGSTHRLETPSLAGRPQPPLKRGRGGKPLVQGNVLV